jgi:hypothetical protein
MEGRIERQQTEVTYKVREIRGRSITRLGRKDYAVGGETNGQVPGLKSFSVSAIAWTENGAIKTAEKWLERVRPINNQPNSS